MKNLICWAIILGGMYFFFKFSFEALAFYWDILADASFYKVADNLDKLSREVY